jgi:hypothetical protein
MSAERTAGRLLRLYPPSWRARYGEELESLIVEMSNDRKVRWLVRADVVVGGLRERLGGGGARGGLSLVLWAWALFMLGGAAVQKTSEHWQDALPPATASTASAAFTCVIVVAAVAGLIVLAGIARALPAFAAFLREGGRPPIRSAVWITAVAMAATIGLAAWASGLSSSQRNGHDALYGVAFLICAALGAVSLLAWTAAATATASRLRLEPSTLKLEAGLAAATAAAMAIMATATAVWWASVAHISPSALTGAPASADASALVPGLVLAAVLMLVATVLAAAGARQALIARK